MSNILELQNLNELNRGIHKHWIWGSNDKFFLSCDYLQKINYSIQDLNREIVNLSNPTMKEVIYIIVLVDWICEAVDSIHKILRKEVSDFLGISNSEEIERANRYFKAIRSFVVAHPLNTNRHKDFGLDGDLICVDVRNKASILVETCAASRDWFLLNFDGLQENAQGVSSDFVLYVYSQKMDEMKYFKFVRANFSDLYYVAKLQIDRLYALDLKLEELTKKKVGVQCPNLKN